MVANMTRVQPSKGFTMSDLLKGPIMISDAQLRAFTVDNGSTFMLHGGQFKVSVFQVFSGLNSVSISPA